ncbi:unnamed protein product [Urochloa humidicola]
MCVLAADISQSWRLVCSRLTGVARSLWHPYSRRRAFQHMSSSMGEMSGEEEEDDDAAGLRVFLGASVACRSCGGGARTRRTPACRRSRGGVRRRRGSRTFRGLTSRYATPCACRSGLQRRRASGTRGARRSWRGGRRPARARRAWRRACSPTLPCRAPSRARRRQPGKLFLCFLLF